MCCKNRHLWLDKENAEKCCSSQWRRVLVFGGGTHPQLCAGAIIGRAWEPLPNARGERPPPTGTVEPTMVCRTAAPR